MADASHVCPVCFEPARAVNARDSNDAGLPPAGISLLCRADGKDVFTCGACTADHVWPAPSPQELKAYYDRPAWFEGGEKGGYENYDAQTSTDLMGTVLAPFARRESLSILDVGCGYGTHLAVAAQKGWKCFGVEPSAHARKIAQERLGASAYIVESIAELIPHEFDIVLLLDVIEHLPSLYPTLYQLFSIGAITAKTRVVITTPNAGSMAARANPAAWEYRHPASHLVHYTAQSLSMLLARLHFKETDVRGASPGAIEDSPGLFVTASGSDFAEFMRERYVPGTWSKLAEYEHMPRYALAKSLATGKRVLDFGCGTGYGAALMAEVAAHVTALDIDAPALAWARENHRAANLDFQRHADLGVTLPAKSFNMVACFEMIEHVDHATQKAAVASIARLLADDGLLLISTPNPAVTALYGANPYHIREMNEAEFRELLGPHFPHIQILRQFVRVGVSLGEGAAPEGDSESQNAMAFIAVCTRKPAPKVGGNLLFDHEVDYVGQFMAHENAVHRLRLDVYNNGEESHRLRSNLDGAVRHLVRAVSERDTAQSALNDSLVRLDQTQRAVDDTTQRLIGREKELMAAEERLMALDKVRAAEAERADRTQAGLDALARQRAEEHASPRFLLRQFMHATRARLRQKLGGKPD